MRILYCCCQIKFFDRITFAFLGYLFLFAYLPVLAQTVSTGTGTIIRQRISINENWRFFKYESITPADNLFYDVRPEVKDYKDDRPADTKPAKAEEIKAKQLVLKSWILPTGNDFIKDPAKHYIRPEGNPGGDFPFIQNDFDDSSWEIVNLPHDWAIKGPFYEGLEPEVGGGMGRLPALNNNLSDILRDFKRFTSGKISELLEETNNNKLLKYFSTAAERVGRGNNYKIWQSGSHAEVIFSYDFLGQKLNYIHNNPVRKGFVESPEHWLFSSARNYLLDDHSILKVDLIG